METEGLTEPEPATSMTFWLTYIQQTRIFTDSNGKRQSTRIMRYRDVLPKFQISNGFVEVPPRGWSMEAPDKEAMELARRMLRRLLKEAGATDGVFDEWREGGEAAGRRIPLEIWDKYADMVIQDEEGAPWWDMQTEPGFDRAQLDICKNLPPSMFCKYVAVSRPTNIQKDVTHPCGLATCTKVIKEAKA